MDSLAGGFGLDQNLMLMQMAQNMPFLQNNIEQAAATAAQRATPPAKPAKGKKKEPTFGEKLGMVGKGIQPTPAPTPNLPGTPGSAAQFGQAADVNLANLLNQAMQMQMQQVKPVQPLGALIGRGIA